VKYYERRKNWLYYQRVKLILEELTEAGPLDSILDVGPADTPVASWGRFEHRATCDIRHDPKIPGARHYMSDFMELELPLVEPFSVVTCLQVLEHLEDPAAFMEKLLTYSEFLIVSVPYRWPKGKQAGHVQDPVTLAKVLQWSAPLEPLYMERIMDRSERMILLYGEPLAPGRKS
jgi:hypothetical protein